MLLNKVNYQTKVYLLVLNTNTLDNWLLRACQITYRDCVEQRELVCGVINNQSRKFDLYWKSIYELDVNQSLSGTNDWQSWIGMCVKYDSHLGGKVYGKMYGDWIKYLDTLDVDF